MSFPVTLNGRTYTLADFEGTNYVEGFPDALEDFVTHAGDTYQTTSTTSVALGTGSKTFTTADSGKPYASGTPLRISSQADETDFIDALVTSYSGTTLVVNAVGFSGSGTLAAWNINIGGGPNTVSGTLPINQGGTGATTASAAATALGLGTGDSPTFAGLTVTGSTSFSDIDIDNVGDIAVDSISGDGDADTTITFAGSDTINIAAGGSTVQSITTSGIDVTGTITFDGGTTSADINFSDNDKAVFGAGSDLQIYHDGTNSIIHDFGTGFLSIKATDLYIGDSGGNTYISAIDNGVGGTVALYHNTAKKLETTSSGVDVTGTVTADGLTVDVNNAGITMTDSSSTAFEAIKTTTSDALQFSSGGSGSFMNFYTNAGNERMRITSGGNVGIGTSSPTAPLSVDETGAAIKLNESNVAADTYVDMRASSAAFGYDSSKLAATIQAGAGNKFISFNVNNNTFGDGEAMRIASNGNVGIGTSSPDKLFHLATTDTAKDMIKMSNGTQDFRLGLNNSSGPYLFTYSNHAMRFGTNSAERMRIDSSGNVGINTTSPNTSYKTTIQADSTTGALSIDGPATNGYWAAEWDMPSGSTYGILFKNNGSNVGNIRINASSTSYNTSSDHRLKEAVVDMTGAITRVKALAPKRFNFIADDSVTVDGFMAHEAQAVVPEAVSGTHNEVDSDGNPVYQGIDQSKLVPLLTGALQEAITKIETLEARVAALEAN